MPAIDIVRVNHVPYSWTSCKFYFDNFEYEGVTDASWEEKRERKLVHAARQDGTPLGITSGKYSVESFTIKMLRASATRLKTQMTAKGLGSYGDAEFETMIQISEPASFAVGAVPLIYLASGCVIVSEKPAHAEGVDELVTEFGLMCLSMSEDGMQLSSLVRELGL